MRLHMTLVLYCMLHNVSLWVAIWIFIVNNLGLVITRCSFDDYAFSQKFMRIVAHCQNMESRNIFELILQSMVFRCCPASATEFSANDTFSVSSIPFSKGAFATVKDISAILCEVKRLSMFPENNKLIFECFWSLSFLITSASPCVPRRIYAHSQLLQFIVFCVCVCVCYQVHGDNVILCLETLDSITYKTLFWWSL